MNDHVLKVLQNTRRRLLDGSVGIALWSGSGPRGFKEKGRLGDPSVTLRLVAHRKKNAA